MDIHFIPGMSAAAMAATAKSKENLAAPDENFRQVLGNVIPKSTPAADAAKQFEGLIIGQVLKAAREASSGGWLGSSDDQTGELALEMAEQGFAQALAARGGLGIAKMVTPILRRDEAKAASSAQSPPGPQVPASTDSVR
jgi:Rod binding domain-containing protein